MKDKINSTGCELISKEYKNNTTPLKVRCKCGNIFETTYQNIQKGTHQCKQCKEKQRIKTRLNSKKGIQYYTYEKVKKIIEENSNTKLLSKEYKSCFDKLELKCECGNVFKQTFAHIQGKLKKEQSLLCPKCMKKITDNSFRLSTKEYINLRIKNHYGYQKFEIYDFENYKNVNYKNLYKHTSCGYIFKSSLKNILNGERLCPNCESEYSKGVLKIINYLNSNDIEYIQEYKFQNCKYERVLPFDFYLPKYNCCIEFDGEQHFRPVGWYGGNENLEKTKIRDNIKNKYCEENNISLLRIKYDEINNIDKILDKFIDKLIPR